MDQATREKISGMLRGQDDLGAKLILRKTTTVEEIKTNFLKTWKILRVDYFGPTGPVLFFFATNLDDQALMLTGNSDAFARVLSNEGARLENAAQAAEYVRLFFETTRPTNIAFSVIRSVEDIRFLPKPNAAEQAQITELRQRLQGQIHEPCAEPVENGHRVTLYVVQKRDLIELETLVFPSGAMQIWQKILAENVPVPYTV